MAAVALNPEKDGEDDSRQQHNVEYNACCAVCGEEKRKNQKQGSLWKGSIQHDFVQAMKKAKFFLVLFDQRFDIVQREFVHPLLSSVKGTPILWIEDSCEKLNQYALTFPQEQYIDEEKERNESN